MNCQVFVIWMELWRSDVRNFLHSCIKRFAWFNACLSNILMHPSNLFDCKGVDRFWKKPQPDCLMTSNFQIESSCQTCKHWWAQEHSCLFCSIQFPLDSVLCKQCHPILQQRRFLWYNHVIQDRKLSSRRIASLHELSHMFHNANQPIYKNKILSHFKQQRTTSLSCNCTQSKREYISIQLNHPE